MKHPEIAEHGSLSTFGALGTYAYECPCVDDIAV